MSSKRSLIALAAGALLLGGCATGPYYDSYAYDDGYYYDRPAYRYYEYGPAYPRYYVAPPSVSFGLAYSNRNRSHWRRY